MDDLKTKSTDRVDTASPHNGCSVPPPPRNLSFSEALRYLKSGMKVRRASWRGHWFMATDVNCHQTMPDHYVRAFGFKNLIVAVLKDCGGCEPAQPYQSDILAEDWEILP